MPPRPRSSSGFRGVRHGPSGMFYAEIPSDDMRLGLGMFESVHEVAHAYNVMAWRLQRLEAQMDFHNVFTCAPSTIEGAVS
ncbi:Protein TRANSPARENT TESTA 12 [Hordeum vulgare]|nr:Protein TRANSPARENT TESTA 12 [Hordeum vulgare]